MLLIGDRPTQESLCLRRGGVLTWAGMLLVLYRLREILAQREADVVVHLVFVYRVQNVLKEICQRWTRPTLPKPTTHGVPLTCYGSSMMYIHSVGDICRHISFKRPSTLVVASAIAQK